MAQPSDVHENGGTPVYEQFVRCVDALGVIERMEIQQEPTDAGRPALTNGAPW